jgi:ABC-type transport system substrate-binding protein
VPQGIPGFDAQGAMFTPHYDVNKAKMYLAKAKAELGSNFPSSLTIKYQAGNASLDAEYTQLQANWKAIGLNVKVQSLDFNSWLNLVTKPTASVTYKGGDPWVENLWIDDYPDAQDFTTNLLTPSTVGNYNDPQFNKWTDQALTAVGSERTQLYIKASRKALNDGAWIMVGQQTINFRWRQNIKGMALWSSSANPQPLNNDWTKVDVQ